MKIAIKYQCVCRPEAKLAYQHQQSAFHITSLYKNWALKFLPFSKPTQWCWSENWTIFLFESMIQHCLALHCEHEGWEASNFLNC